jgi:hypothetical protein
MKRIYLVKEDGTFGAWVTETQAKQIIESAKEDEYLVDLEASKAYDDPDLEELTKPLPFN